VVIHTVLATSDLYTVTRDQEDRPIIGCDYTVCMS
jgi:hypothetical protein